MKKETGGPAFPLHQHGTQTLGMHITGMTLRDYFAAKAMPELIGWGEPDDIAVKSYKYADAMLEARKCKK